MDIDNKQLERDIENAVRARGLREQMQQWEADLHRIPKPGVEPAAAATPMDQKPQSKSSAWPKLRRTIYTLSAVAVLAGIVIMAVPTAVWKSSYRQASRWAYRQYAHYFAPAKTTKVEQHVTTQPETLISPEVMEWMAMATPSVTRLANDRQDLEIQGHEDTILDAAAKIQHGDYAGVEDILAEAREALSPNDPHYQQTLEDIEYLEALCLLGQDQREKAKQLLTAIAHSNSRHRKAAAKLVEKIQ